MSYHTPGGFADRCVMRRDDAEHQIRLIQRGSDTYVSCTCLPQGGGAGGPGYQPIAQITEADEAWEQWRTWHGGKAEAGAA